MAEDIDGKRENVGGFKYNFYMLKLIMNLIIILETGKRGNISLSVLVHFQQRAKIEI